MTNRPPDKFAPQITDIQRDSVTVAFGASDPDGDPLSYRVAVTTSPTPPSDFSQYDEVQSPYTVVGAFAPQNYQFPYLIEGIPGRDGEDGITAVATHASDPSAHADIRAAIAAVELTPLSRLTPSLAVGTSGAVTVDFAASAVQRVHLTGAATLNISNVGTQGRCSLSIYAGEASRAIAFTGIDTWGGEAPAVVDADQILVVTVFSDGQATFAAATSFIDGGFTPPANRAPNTFTPTISDITQTGATVTFATTDPDGEALTYRVAVTTSSTPPADWSGYSDMTSPILVPGLTPETTYYAHVRAFDGELATVGTSEAFSTLAGGDTTPPTLTGSLTATGGSEQVTLSWTAGSDNVGVTGYDVEHGTTTAYGTATTSTTPSKTLTGLAAGTLYYVRVRAFDAAGNKSAWLTASATTEAAAANQPPAAFTPTVSAITDTTATVTWATTDPEGDALTYRVAVTTSATPPDVSAWAGIYGAYRTSPFVATGLTLGATYYAHVRAYDGSPLYTTGTSAPFVTTGAADTTAPVIAGTLTATVDSATQVTLAGPTATDNVGIAKWQYRVDAGAWVDVASTSTTFPATAVGGLTAETAYTFGVRALDAASNASAEKTASATTQAAPALWVDNFDTLDSTRWETRITSPATLDVSGGRLVGSAGAVSRDCAAITVQAYPLDGSYIYTVKGRLGAAVNQRVIYPANGAFNTYMAFASFSNVPRSNAVSIACQTAAGWRYWYTSGWLASGGTMPTVPDPETIEYQYIFETSATSGIRYLIKSADGTTTILTTDWIPWTSLAPAAGKTLKLFIGQSSDPNWYSDFTHDYASVQAGS